MLIQGADIDAEDDDGSTALSIAAKFNHKSCERHLFLFRWQERAKRTKPSEEPDRMAHQFFDSAFPVWMKGQKCQLYMTNILPPGEYEGTRLDSPKKKMHNRGFTEDEIKSLERQRTEESFEIDPNGFDEDGKYLISKHNTKFTKTYLMQSWGAKNISRIRYIETYTVVIPDVHACTKYMLNVVN